MYNRKQTTKDLKNSKYYISPIIYSFIFINKYFNNIRVENTCLILYNLLQKLLYTVYMYLSICTYHRNLYQKFKSIFYIQLLVKYK